MTPSNLCAVDFRKNLRSSDSCNAGESFCQICGEGPASSPGDSALTQYRQTVLDISREQFRSTHKLSILRLSSAPATNVARDAGDVVKDIGVVGVALVLIAATVRDNSLVQNVKLSDGPCVETRLRKDKFERRLVTDLDTASTKAKSPEAKISRECAKIVVVEDPTLRRNAAVHPWDDYPRNSGGVTDQLGPHQNDVGVWPVDWTNSVHEDPQVSWRWDVSEELAYFPAEAERRGKRYRGDLTQIGPDRRLVQEVVPAVSHYSSKLNLEERRRFFQRPVPAMGG